MSDYQDMTEDQIRLLNLEAKVLQMQCQLIAIRDTFLAYLQKTGVRFAGKPADEHTKLLQQQALEDLLRGLADFDAERASKISRILLPPK